MGPVFLFGVDVVIFVVGYALGEVDGLFSVGEVPQEVVIEELAVVVAIEAEVGERAGFFDVFDLFERLGFAFAPDGALLGPSGGNIDKVNGIDVHTGGEISAMGDGIGFEESWSRFIPLIGFNVSLGDG